MRNAMDSTGAAAFEQLFGRDPVVLDGGLGTLLESRGNDLSSPLWSAQMLLDAPDEIRRAHREYFAAGARVAIAASYQVAYLQLAELGLDAIAVDDLLALSIQLARDARDDARLVAPGATGDVAWVAASVGPYGAPRADGSEYRGDYGLSVDELRGWHRRRLRAMAAAHPDIFAVETIPSYAEVDAISAEIAGLGIPTWISVTVADGRLRSGEPMESAFARAASVDEVVAVGVNCCDPTEVSRAIAAARSVTDKALVVYPNSGETWDAENRRWAGATGVADGSVAQWLSEGARLVGGCCRIGPADISRIAAEVRAGA
ncbi:homocysteine S-methyltransferase [Agreia pratensis]|nr:homocysteine S-methyltransferase [Agreia pratensis]